MVGCKRLHKAVNTSVADAVIVFVKVELRSTTTSLGDPPRAPAANHAAQNRAAPADLGQRTIGHKCLCKLRSCRVVNLGAIEIELTCVDHTEVMSRGLIFSMQLAFESSAAPEPLKELPYTKSKKFVVCSA